MPGAVNKIIQHIENKGFETKEIGLAWMEQYLKDVSLNMLESFTYSIYIFIS